VQPNTSVDDCDLRPGITRTAGPAIEVHAAEEPLRGLEPPRPSLSPRGDSAASTFESVCVAGQAEHSQASDGEAKEGHASCYPPGSLAKSSPRLRRDSPIA
jgi:hypothetical protein